MKRAFLFILAALLSVSSFAQQEPKFAKDAALLNEDGTTTMIPATIGNMSITFQVTASGPSAEVRIPYSQTVRIIVRVNDQNVAPIDVFRAFKMTVKGEDRKASMGGYGIRSKALIPFSADYYGKSSFVLTFRNLEPGEYGIMYCADEIEKNMLGEHPITCFGIDAVTDN